MLKPARTVRTLITKGYVLKVGSVGRGLAGFENQHGTTGASAHLGDPGSHGAATDDAYEVDVAHLSSARDMTTR